MTLQVVPEGLLATAAGVEALAARLSAAHTAAAAVTTVVVPPAADPVSLQNAAGLSAHAGQHRGVAIQGVIGLGHSAAGVGQSGASYATGDSQAATTYLVAGGGG